MKKRIFIFIFTLFTACYVSAAVLFINVDIPVVLRRGPSIEYKAILTLNPGDKVTFLQKSENGRFTQIKDSNGRVAWVESNLLTGSPTLRERYPQLEREYAALKNKVDELENSHNDVSGSYEQQLAQANKKIADLEKINNELSVTTKQQAVEIDTLKKDTDTERQNELRAWFVRGGIVAGVGLLIGLILPVIITKRRRKDRWA